MGRPYYYFAASLPMLHWGGKPSVTVDDFLSMARRLLTEDDGALIERILKGDDGAVETDNAAARSWLRFNRDFRNEQAWFRAQRANKDPLAYIRGAKENEPSLRGAVHDAAKISDLLEAEESLDGISWRFLDDLGAGHYYDFEFLICYGLKLKILERHQGYHSSKGSGMFAGMREMELPA